MISSLSTFARLSVRTARLFSTRAAAAQRSVTTYNQYINGQWTPSSSSETIDVENPSTHELLSQVPAGTAQDAQMALEAAQAAQPAWEKVPAVERGNVLSKLSEIMQKSEHRERLAQSLADEQAKTLGLAQVEIDASCDYLRYHAGWARIYEGEIVNSDRAGEQIYLQRVPLGVSAGICPWNFPIYVFMRKIAPALVTGNTVVVKLSEYTPNTAMEITKLFEEAGVPPGVVNVVVGRGDTIGQALTESTIPSIISMTGSVATGQKIMETASKNLTKVSLELGGKAPVLVMADCNIESTIDDIWNSRSLYTGQVCNSPERIYVQEAIYDEFLEKLVRRVEQTKVGLPNDEGIAMCGLINPNQLKKVSSMVERAVQQDGAHVETGGKVNEAMASGYHFEPTVLTGVKQTDDIMQTEIFGPVLPVMKFDTLDTGLELANDCQYGLTSSIFTNNAAAVHRVMTELKFGETYVNRDHFEGIQGFHAGWRKSGVGGCDGKHGLFEYLGTRTVYWNNHSS